MRRANRVAGQSFQMYHGAKSFFTTTPQDNYKILDGIKDYRNADTIKHSKRNIQHRIILSRCAPNSLAIDKRIDVGSLRKMTIDPEFIEQLNRVEQRTVSLVNAVSALSELLAQHQEAV